MSRAEHLRRVHDRLQTAFNETQQTYYKTRAHIARNGDLPCTELGPIERALVETRRAIECVESELRIAARQESEPVKESLTTEQPEGGPAAWLVDYGDGSDPEVYDGERPPGVAAECSMTPLYPESVKAERDALREQLRQLEQRDFQELARANERIDALMNEVRTLRDDRRAAGERVRELVDALELARGEIAHYFKETRHLGGSWEVKRALDRVDQVLDAYPRHGDAAMQEGE